MQGSSVSRTKLAAWVKRNVHPVETPMILGLALMMGAILARSMLVAGIASAVILLTAAANLLTSGSPADGQAQSSKDGEILASLEVYEHL